MKAKSNQCFSDNRRDSANIIRFSQNWEGREVPKIFTAKPARSHLIRSDYEHDKAVYVISYLRTNRLYA